MELLIVGGALAGSVAGAFFLQKAALEMLLRTMFHQ
jgi:hypothetical protein